MLSRGRISSARALRRLSEFKGFSKSKYDADGYYVLPNFFDSGIIDDVRAEFTRLVNSVDLRQHTSVFSTKDQRQGKDAYFLQSGDKISYFFEENYSVEREPTRPRALAINKVGHALHDLNPVFRRFSWDPRVHALAKALLEDPVMVQSMYICKQAGIGGEVGAHQDATFLRSTPDTVIGLWIAMEDATKVNGCLWALPGSHLGPLYATFRRTPDDSKAVLAGSYPPFEPKHYVPLEVKKGSLIVLHGRVLHASEENRSNKTRHAYTLHLKERAAVWERDNWLRASFHGWETEAA